MRALWLVAITSICNAGEFTGVVNRVIDGDTMIVSGLHVRLSEIDAPEHDQPYGRSSLMHLKSLCNNTARIVYKHKDKYGRIIGDVYCNGVNANYYQVKSGMAWAYDRYVIHNDMYDMQLYARRHKLGLWKDNDPIVPSIWRQSHQYKAHLHMVLCK
jgi:endonuclease YncB( thermonuclease family)